MRRLGELVEILRKKSYPEKLKAIEELKGGQSPEFASALITALYDADTRIRKAASDALISLGGIAINPLLSGLKTTDRNIRRNILLILSKIAENNPSLEFKIEEILINCLKDPDPVVKAQAGETLGKMKSKRAIPHLLPLLTDINFWVRSLATLVLGELGITADEATKYKLIAAITERLNDPNHWVRRSACESLGKLRAKGAVEKLSELTLNDPSDIVQDAAIEALRTIGEIYFPPYEKAILSPNIRERMKAIATLVKEGEAASSSLIPLLATENEELKVTIVSVLGEIGDKKATEHLLRLTSTGKGNLRLQALNALAKVKEERVVKNLVSFLSHPDSSLSDGAKVSLEKMGEYVIPFLTAELTNPDPQVRMKICEILGNVGNEAISHLLIKSLSDENAWVRAAACEALGKIGGKGVIPYIIIALKDHSPLVRAKGCEVLGRFRTPFGISELTARLKDEDTIVKVSALKAIAEIRGEGAKPLIIEALGDADVEVRVAAVHLLGELGAIETLPLLEKISRPWPFSREEEEVKEVCRQVIKKFKEVLARGRIK
jgi:HEAT repeat protein